MADTNGTLIKMEGVKKVFLTDEVETHALEEIHLEILKGQYVSISGPSGCGKSTLLSILGLLDSPTDGNYLLNGQPVANLTASERTRIRNRERSAPTATSRCSSPSTSRTARRTTAPAARWAICTPSSAAWHASTRRTGGAAPATRAPRSGSSSTHWSESEWRIAFVITLRNFPAVNNSALRWPAHWSVIR